MPEGEDVRDPHDGDARSMSGRYVAALAIEVVVLVGLWAFGAYFGA